MLEQLRFVHSKGCLSLKGSCINAIAGKWDNLCRNEVSHYEKASSQRHRRDGNDYHVTVISSSELKTLSAFSSADIAASTLQSLNDSLLQLPTMAMYDIGVGCYKESVFYVILFVPFLQKTRLNLKLPPTDLHITLAFHDSDVHEIRKGFSTLMLKDNDADLFRTIEQILRGKSSPDVRNRLQYRKMAEFASGQGYLFGAYYLAKYQENPLMSSDILELAISDAGHCKRASNDEIDYGDLVCKALNYFLYSSKVYHHRLRRYYTSVSDSAIYKISFQDMPRNFSFVSENVAGSSLPDQETFKTIADIGITDVITVMERPLDKSYHKLPLRFHWFEVIDRTPPSMDQMKSIMDICDRKGHKTLIHCLGGVGRTATVLAAHLMWTKGLTRQEAKAPIIESRKTIISSSQDEFLTSWFFHCVENGASNSIKNVVNISNSVPLKNFPALIMCVGLPGSGKSTFSQALCDSNAMFVRLNQDEQGRKECEKSIGSVVKQPGKTVILDRCNLTRKERKEWLDLAHKASAWVVFFSTPPEECKWRIVRRTGHPTLKNGQSGRVIDKLVDTVEVPSIEEGFRNMFNVNSFDACNELLRSWGCLITPQSTIPEELGLHKFPRTRHILNLGSATRDDLILSKEEVAQHFLNREVWVEEKVDGANMGLSINNNRICAQNRSHYVSSEYHPQFKHLDKWIHQHSATLWDILESGRCILFGEWCYAEHSIAYKKLPDWFVAFDIFDRLENKFWSRNRLESVLADTGIPVTPLICKKSFSSVEDLKALVHTKSRYYDGPVEGVVVRVPDSNDLFVAQRGKIVRSDFLSGNTHWSKHGCTPNQKELEKNISSGF